MSDFAKNLRQFRKEKGYVFLTQDPIMDWEISNGTEWIELQAKIFTFLPESKVDCLFNEGQVLFNRKLQKLEEQEAHMAMLEKEHAVLQKELENEEIEKHLLQKQSDEIRRKWQEREVEFALKNQEAENKVKVLEETLLKVTKDAINLEDALLEVKIKVESLEQELENREAKNLDLSRMQEGLVQEKIFLQEQYHSQKEMIVALENRVFELTDSTCWKITKPIRVVGIFLKKLVKPKTYGRMLKRIYMAFPLSMGTKLKVKGALFTVLAPLIKNTEPYRDWKNYNAGCVETEAVPQKINERQNSLTKAPQGGYCI